MEELKPCPFCGGKANIRAVMIPVKWIKNEPILRKKYCAECVNDKCYVAPVSDEKDTEEEAARIWNMRAEYEK